MKKLLQLLLITISFASLLSALTLEDLLQYPSKKTSYYGESFSPVLMEKVRDFSGNAEEYLESFDNFDGYKNHKLSDREKALFEETFALLPEKLQQTVTENVYAIYFVDGMWYGALTDIVYDETRHPYCIMFFNAEAFNYTLDEWLTYRDNTIFKDTDSDNRVVVETGCELSAFVQLFIHESTHVYDFINQVTPYQYIEETPRDNSNLFYSIWKNKQEPLKKYQNKKFEQTAFYEYGTKIPIKNGKEIIDYLGKTPFCTPYAATNWMDDFAEEVTFYYLHRRLGIDYKLTYIQNGKAIASYSYVKNQNARLYDSLCKEITGL